MKTSLKVTRFLTCRLIAIPLVFACLLAFAGCATRKQVAEIVSQSNAAMLAGQFGLPDPKGSGAQPTWQTESDRIEAFITAHPELEATTAPLRIRQAMLLLTHRQFSIARAAFNQVQETNLFTPRDQALKRNQETLLWWFASSTNHTWTTSDWKQSTNSLTQLKEEQLQLAGSPEIRDYLAEMRAWIGLTAARHSTSTNSMRSRLEDALNVYSKAFTTNELKILAGGTDESPESKPLPVEARRQLRAKAVLEAGRKLNQEKNLNARLREAVLKEWINRPIE